MAESSEKLANFLLKSNINEIRSLLDEKKKKIIILEGEFSAAHRISSIRESLTNLKAQILQLNFAKVIDAIDSTLKIQTVCQKFEENRKNHHIPETPVITILDEDTDDKNDKKDPIEDQEIEFIIEEDEVVQQQEDKQIHKSNSPIKDSSLNQGLKTSKKQSKEDNPAKSKRDIFKRLIKTKRKINQEEENEEEDEDKLTQGVKGKETSRQQEQQQRKRQPRRSSVQQQYQQQILDEFFSSENGAFDVYETDYDEYQRLEDICEEDNTEEDEDYCESASERRPKKRGSLPQRKNIRKTSNKNNGSYKSHRKNTHSSEDNVKIQQKLTHYGTKRLQNGGESEKEQSKAYRNRKTHPVKLPASYTEYLTHLINISSDNNLSIPKIFLNEQFYENRRLNSNEILLASKEKQFVIKLLKALHQKIEKVEGYLLLPHELILELVQQDRKKIVQSSSQSRNQEEEDEDEEEQEQEEEGTDDQIISTPRKKRIIDSEDDGEIEVEKKQKKQQEIIGVITEIYDEGDDSFECDFNVKGNNINSSLLNKSKEPKTIQQQGNIKNVKNWKNTGESLRQEINPEDLLKKQYNLNNEKELKKRIQTQNDNNDSRIYNEESDEELRENVDPKEFVDVTEVRTKIKAEKNGPDEQIYF